MKKLLVVVTVIALGVNSINAVPPQRVQQNAKVQNGKQKVKTYKENAQLSIEDRAKRNSDTLNVVMKLSKEQYDKIYAINIDYITKKEAVKSKYKTSIQETPKSSGDIKNNKYHGAMGQEIKALNKERSTQVFAVVTPEQKAAWKAWKDKKQAEHPKFQKGFNKYQEKNSNEKEDIEDLEIL